METKKFKYPPIFLSSTDSYADIWDLFFTLFKKYWPEYNGVIYLNTEQKDIYVEGLNIVCTKFGNTGYFGSQMRKCLDLIDSEDVLLILIDFIFMGQVNDTMFKKYFNFFKNNNLDTLNFKHYESENQFETDIPNLVYVKPPAKHRFFNYQIAFWKKKTLYQMVLPHENPWTSEWYGAKRAEKMNIKQALVKGNDKQPFNYHASGCLAKAQWHPYAVQFITNNNIEVDFNKRGYFIASKRSIKHRLKVKWMIVKDGLKGSYIDLWKRNRRTLNKNSK